MTSRAARSAALLFGALLVSAGCAQPGQLGHPPPAPPPPAAPPAPVAPLAAAPPGPALIGSGLLDERLNLRTPGPAEYTVRTIVLAPGEDTGWHRHPGTELTIVTAGRVSLRTADDCAPATVPSGKTAVVPDAVPHVLRNEGRQPAELVVTHLLAPDEPAEADVDPPC